MFSGETNFPQTEPAAMGIDNSTLGTSEQGRPLPVFWGRKKLGCTFISNAFWKQATQPGGDSGAKKTPTGSMGYYYAVQYAAALCAGPVDAIYEMWINGQPVTLLNEAFPILRTDHPVYVDIEMAVLDVTSRWRFYWGTELQTIDTPVDTEGQPILTEHTWEATRGFYLSDLAQEWWASDPSRVAEFHPAYKGVCYFVARYHQWLGQTTCPKIEFVLGRYNGYETEIGRIGPTDAPDANPVDIIKDCLTNARYGLGLPASAFNAADFAAVKATLATEGLGVSPFIDRAQSFDQFLLELLGYVDGFYAARPDGAMTLGLNRGVPCSAAVDTKAVIEEDSLTELPDIEAAGINTTRTEVRVQFINSALDWKDDCCAGHSAGTLQMLGTPVAETLDRPWVLRIEVADKMARAAAKHRALPTVRGTLTVRKSRLQGLTLGAPFYFNYAHYGLCHLHCRVTELTVSDPFSPVVEIGFEQDHGFLNAEAYDATKDYDAPAAPVYTAPDIVDALLIELPATPYAPQDKDPRFVALVSRPDIGTGAMVNGCLFRWLYDPENGLTRNISRNSAGMTFPARCQLLETINEAANFVKVRIVSMHDKISTGAFPQEIPAPPADGDVDWMLIFDGADEILALTSVTLLADGSYTLGIRRGILDTVAQTITTATPVCYAVRLSTLTAMQLAVRAPLDIGDAVTIKVYSVIGRTASVDSEDTKTLTCTYRNRAGRPWKPRADTTDWPDTWGAGTASLIITWVEQYRFGEIPNDWDGPVWTIDVRLPDDPFNILDPATGRRYLGEETPHATSHTINAAALATALGGRQTCVVRLYTRDTKTGLCSLWWDQKTIDFA